jgi:hypothetical protein
MKSQLALLLLASVSLFGCAPSSDDADTSTGSDDVIEGDAPKTAETPPRDSIEIKVDDLDSDGVQETLTSERENCGTGGCQWKIHLSRLGDAGEVFAKFISPLPQGTEDEAASFFAYQRGGMCYGSFVKFVYEGGKYQEKSSIDCNEVIKRPEGAPIAQFEMQCLDQIPPECRDLP